jgi:hypothetical protein
MKRSVFDHLGKALAAAVRPTLVLSGLGWLCAASWAAHPIAGMTAIGIASLYLEWATRS